MSEIFCKGEFADRRGVHKSAVSHWIKTGRIYGGALVGSGRSAKINVAVAEAQLSRTLDLGQRLAHPAPPGVTAEPRSLPTNDDAARYQKAKADAAEIEAERARRRMEEERGRYILADEARDAWSRELSRLVERLERWVTDAAQDIANAQAEAGGPLDQKGLTAVVSASLRRFRASAAIDAAERRDASPEFASDPAQSR